MEQGKRREPSLKRVMLYYALIVITFLIASRAETVFNY